MSSLWLQLNHIDLARRLFGFPSQNRRKDKIELIHIPHIFLQFFVSWLLVFKEEGRSLAPTSLMYWKIYKFCKETNCRSSSVRIQSESWREGKGSFSIDISFFITCRRAWQIVDVIRLDIVESIKGVLCQ